MGQRSAAFDVSLLIPLLITFLQSIDEATLISMMTEGHVFVLNHGQTLDISCEFLTDDFDMFDNPVVWKKFQRQEETQINIMGNIFEPFLASNRFEVNFETNAPRYCLRLRITNLTSEDSGNYTCEVRGRKSTILAQVTHFIFVRATVKMLFLTTDNASGHPAISNRLTKLVAVEGRPQRLRCFSTGGYPAPEVHVTLDDRDISDQFTLYSSTSFYGKLGLRLMMTQTERRTDLLDLKAEDDGARIRCVVVVPGLVANVTEIIVEVNYGPIISCSSTSAYLGQRNLFLRCVVRARPEVTSLFWIIDVNGTTLSKGEVINEYWSLTTDRSDGVMETQLHMKQALPHSFRTYTVVAENAITIKTQLVQLNKIKHSTLSAARRFTNPTMPTTSGNVRNSNQLPVHRIHDGGGGGRGGVGFAKDMQISRCILIFVAIIVCFFNIMICEFL